MNWRLAILRLYLPAAVKRNRLRELFSLTAEAFDCADVGACAAPGVDGLSYGDCLRRYALFTREQAEKALERGSGPVDLAETRDRLYRNARRFGQGMRRQLEIASLDEAFKAIGLLYRAIGIDLAWRPLGELSGESPHESPGQLPGELHCEAVISRCFFSDFYSEDVCRIVSALDAGVVTGISGGGQLEFYQRLTGGHECCRAHFRFEGEGE